MDFNMFLLRFGFDPFEFENTIEDPIKEDDGTIAYFINQKDVLPRRCPFCNSSEVVIKSHYTVRVKDTRSPSLREALLIRKPKYLCKSCGKFFTKELAGIGKYGDITEFQKMAMVNDFITPMPFSLIARRYGVSCTYAIKEFDKRFPVVPALGMPKVLCIDEIHFSSNKDEKFPAVIYDWERRELVDVIKSRQMPYMKEYFDRVRPGNLATVRYFISDMYDGYATIRRIYFPNAMHIVDFFHVIQLLTNAVSKLRTAAMNAQEKGSFEYDFMKGKWALFLCRKKRIPQKLYEHRKDGEIMPYPDAVFRCVKSSVNLWDGYDILQELYEYHEYATWTEADNFVERIATRLLNTSSELLKSVGRSYKKWRAEIANGLAKNQTGYHFSNGVAEGMNAQIQGLKRAGHGYSNFERFRKRVLLIYGYSKDKEKGPR
jgi:transposase